MFNYDITNWNPLKGINNKEWSMLVLTFILFICSPWLLRMLDFAAAPIDIGILSAVLLAIFTFLLFKAITWWLVITIWPVLGTYAKEHFERNFKSLISWQKVLIYLSFYLALLFGFVATLAAIL